MPINIGLKEVIQIVRESKQEDLVNLVHDDRLTGFYDGLNECGTDALQSLSTEDALSAFEFIQIATILQLISFYQENDDLPSILEVMELSNSEVFQNAIKLATKSGIGLAISEELI